MKIRFCTVTAFVLAAGLHLIARAASFSEASEADYTIRNFRFRSGEVLPELRVHYRTLGAPRRDEKGVIRNAVLILHGTTGSGAQFMRPEFAGELFGKGQLLDAEKYFLILPDGIGHGKSGKPSDGLHARFPKYGYSDMVEAQYRLLAERLGVNHLRLVMGTSMGGMHTWVWGEEHPDFMDALMPLASLPAQISGRNRAWRKLTMDAIQNDPAWNGGEYTRQPPGLRVAAGMLFLMGSNPVQRQKEAPTLPKADEVFETAVTNSLAKLDANDALYAFAASQDYDPAPRLAEIRAPLLAINSADDLINPPELKILEREIKRVKQGRAIVIPLSDKTRGHGTHTLAVIWKKDLAKLLKRSVRK